MDLGFSLFFFFTSELTIEFYFLFIIFEERFLHFYEKEKLHFFQKVEVLMKELTLYL